MNWRNKAVTLGQLADSLAKNRMTLGQRERGAIYSYDDETVEPTLVLLELAPDHYEDIREYVYDHSS